MSQSFLLAPMSPLIRVFTVISQDILFRILAVFLIGLYGCIWLCRPYCFIVSSDTVKILFPIWQRRILIREVSSICIINKESFDQEFGWAIRIGAGGLWGGFGWLWTAKKGILEFYISRLDRLDRFVLLERLTGQRILFTPDRSEHCVKVIQDILSV